MFSIIIPVHNKLTHLDRSINSVLNQTYKEFELILIDDASSDGSEERIKGYKDPRIICFRRDMPGPGGYAARNLGIEKAKYDWICFLDADDEWSRQHLDDIAQAISKYDGVEIISTNWERSKRNEIFPVKELSKFKKYYTEFSIKDFFYTKSLMWTGAIAIKKDLLNNAGLFPVGKCKRGGDMDTWIRSLEISKKNIFISKSSSLYFVDIPGQVTDNKINPANSICAQETLNKIRSKNNKDKKLTKAIDYYLASFIYGFMLRSLKENNIIEKEMLNIVHTRRIRLNILLRLYIYKFLILLKIK